MSILSRWSKLPFTILPARCVGSFHRKNAKCLPTETHVRKHWNAKMPVARPAFPPVTCAQSKPVCQGTSKYRLRGEPWLKCVNTNTSCSHTHEPMHKVSLKSFDANRLEERQGQGENAVDTKVSRFSIAVFQPIWIWDRTRIQIANEIFGETLILYGFPVIP